MTSNKRTVTKILLTLALALLPQLALAQTNTFPTSGNAGVGTTSPGDALQIVKDNGGLTLDTATSGTNVPVFRFSTTGTGRASIQYRPDLPGLAFQTGGIAYPAQSRMVLTDSGNFGIGTTSPLGRFHLVAPSYTDTSIPAWDNRFLVVGADSNTGGISLSYNQTTNTGYLMSLSPNVAWRNTVIQPFGGNVGIGTTTPAFGGITSSTYLTLAASGSNRPAFEFVSNLSDGVGKEAGFLDFVFNTNSAGHKRIGNISVDTEGATANQRGGVMRLFTKPDGSATMLERMRIDSAGNIGIGTTSPSARFHISAGDSSFALFGPNTTWGGSLAVGSGAAFVTPISGRAQVLSSNGNLHLDGGTNQSVYIGWLTPSTTIINGQGGSVGIGTSTPNYKLDVNGEINATGVRINGTPISGGGSSQWTGTSSIYYNGGNVGIGTTGPSDALQIDSPTGWALRLRYTGTGHYLRMSSNQMSAYTPAGVGSDLLLNVDGGKVGVGMVTPTRLFSLNAASSPYLSFNESGAEKMVIGTEAAGYNRRFIVYDSSAAQYRFVIDNSGNVGIGTPTPNSSYKLDVAGNINSSATITGNNIAAKYQDVAEWVQSSEQLSAATVVVLDAAKSNQVISSTTSYDTRVAGVVSAQPGITLGESGAGKVLVATTGRVRVKVDASRGAIQIGDLLVTSDVLGVAMKSEPVEFAGRKMHMPGTIIGKALEPMAKGTGEILVLLSLQ